MMNRRSFLAATAAILALPRRATGQQPRYALEGELRQGELVIGKTEAGTRIALDGKPLRVSQDGRFAFGFPYNQKTRSVLVLRYADGMSESRDITPQLRDYEIQRISGLPAPYVTPPDELLARIKRESEIMRRVHARDTDSVWFADGFDWPIAGIVSSLFGSQRILNGEPRAPHLAVDIAAPTGTPIRAPADGIVSLIGDFYFDGGFTILDHGHGVSTCYGHQSKKLVAEGDKVLRGQVLGEVGQTGRATGPHLHWGMNWFQTDVDPSLSTPTTRPPKT